MMRYVLWFVAIAFTSAVVCQLAFEEGQADVRKHTIVLPGIPKGQFYGKCLTVPPYACAQDDREPRP